MSMGNLLKVALFGKRAFLDVIKLKLLRCDHPGLAWTPNRKTVSLKERSHREDMKTRQNDMSINQEMPGAVTELCALQIHTLKFQLPGPQNASVFGNRTFKEVMKLI